MNYSRISNSSVLGSYSKNSNNSFFLKLSVFVDLLQVVVDRVHLYAEELGHLLLAQPKGLILEVDLDAYLALRRD